MELSAKLVFLGLAGGVLYLACRPRYVFLVRVVNGETRVSTGKVTSAFLTQLAETCGRTGVQRGWVGGVLRGKRVALRFSRSIPTDCRQRLRNLWALHG